MQNSSVILVDSGRFPLWFRLPALIFGLGSLWLGVDIVADTMFGVDLGFHGTTDSPALASLGCFAIAALWIFIWFAQLRIVYDQASQALVVWTRGYFRPHERRISVVGAQAIHIHKGYRATWRISVEFSDGHSEQVTDLTSGAEILAAAIRANTPFPVRWSEGVV